ECPGKVIEALSHFGIQIGATARCDDGAAAAVAFTTGLFVTPLSPPLDRSTVQAARLPSTAASYSFGGTPLDGGTATSSLSHRFLQLLAIGGALGAATRVVGRIRKRAAEAVSAGAAASNGNGLHVSNLHAVLAENPEVSILNGVTLDLEPGEVVALLGPNGCGKSSFARVMMGDSQYEVTHGRVEMDGEDVLALDVDERASKLGLFMSWQAPVEVPGITNFTLLHAALNASRQAEGLPELSPFEFYDFAKSRLMEVERGVELLEYLDRPVNTGMSGGERKRVELLHAVVLRPKLCVFDEIDSGLDVDALKQVATTLRSLCEVDKSMTMLIVSHYKRMLDELHPRRLRVVALFLSLELMLPKQLTAKGAKRRKMDIPKKIGFRGRWFHGKELDDPVFKTHKIPHILIPKTITDWRNGGRALLCIAMAQLEDIKIRTRGAAIRWQHDPKKGCQDGRCGSACSQDFNRCMCAWRVEGTKHHHFSRMDGVLMKYKGDVPVHHLVPIWGPMKAVGLRNRRNSLPYRVQPDGSLIPCPIEASLAPHPAFNESKDFRYEEYFKGKGVNAKQDEHPRRGKKEWTGFDSDSDAEHDPIRMSAEDSDEEDELPVARGDDEVIEERRLYLSVHNL
ncbi:hypothetical protein FOZ62_025833, partial [Perkinsus olseni]